MKVVICGGAGYIGCHVVQEALAAGHQVVVYDNLSHATKDNLPADVPLVVNDIADAHLTDVLSDGVDAVIHLAASKSVGESMENPALYAKNNIAGTIHVLSAMQKSKVRHLIFSSTAAVYGTPEFLPLSEEHPVKPDSFYGFTKLEVERILGWFDTLNIIRYAALRYFNVVGYGSSPAITVPEVESTNILPVIMEVASGKRDVFNIFGNDYNTPDGTGIRDYIHVSDIARAHIQALDYVVGKQESLTVNLGVGKGSSVLEMLNAVEECSKKTIATRMAPRRAGDPAVIYATANKAQDLLMWKPAYTELRDMVQTAWDVYKAYYSVS